MYFWKLVAEVIKKADIILFIADARMPELSRHADFEALFAKKQTESMTPKIRIIVFNKKDLVSGQRLKDLEKEFSDAFFVSATKNEGIGILRRHIQILAKSMKRHEPKVGVVGYPNVGKSAVINTLARRARARVTDKPGTTRGIQWVKAGSLRILDSPGVIPLRVREDTLALIGSKRAEKLAHPDLLAIKIIHLLLEQDPTLLAGRYGLSREDITQSADEILLLIGKKRGFLSKGGVVDEMKTALMIVHEWQKGKLKV